MEIKKTYSTDLLDTPVGTKMYMVITNYRHTGIFIEEVTYEGYSARMIQRDYYEPKMIGPVYWEEPEFDVKFKRSSGKTPITFTCRYYDCGGADGFKTDEHIETGTRNFKGLKLSAYGFDNEETNPIVYFTTDEEKLKAFMKNNIPEIEKSLENVSSTYDKELEKLEAKYAKEKKTLVDRFATYKKALVTLQGTKIKYGV